MKTSLLFSFLCFSLFLNAQVRYEVSSGTEFHTAQEQAVAGDSIVWISGTYRSTRMDINKDGLIITAQPYGTVLFTGVSRVTINASDITFSGFQYIGGFLGNLDVIRVFGSDVLITHVNIQDYTCFKYLVVDEDSRRTTISYCNFENRLNLDDKNILSILVDNEPGYHKIQHCSFKNFDGSGNDLGIEPIRIGVSTQAHLDSRTLVEYCYFARCSGDGEIISHKARQNVYRYNTFEDNALAELVLRHGDEGIVYGNFFLNNMGGIRVREGSGHFIYNNYFQGLSRRSIFLQNDPSDPLSDIHIYHNIIIDSEEFRLGGVGANPPNNVIIANNIFVNPKSQLFDEETGEESWENNFTIGNLGIERPMTGLTETDPALYENAEGYAQPEENSPVIASASSAYPEVPLYTGMDYDHELLWDLMKEPRPVSVTDRAIGASEYSPTMLVQPHATETNSGPAYLFDNLITYLTANATQIIARAEGQNRLVNISSNTDWRIENDVDWVTTDLTSGAGNAAVNLIIAANPEAVRRSGTITIIGAAQMLDLTINQDPGELVSVIEVEKTELVLFPNPTGGTLRLTNTPEGNHSALLELITLEGKRVFSKSFRKTADELLLDLDDVQPGVYLLNIQFLYPNGVVHSEETIKIVKK